MSKRNYTQIIFFSFVSIAIVTGIILLAVTNSNTSQDSESNATNSIIIPESISPSGVTGTEIQSPVGDQFSQCTEAMFKIQDISEFRQTFSYSVDQRFYKKFINVGGVPIASSNMASDRALAQAAKWACNLINLAKPQAVQGLIQSKSKITVIGLREQIVQVPEFLFEDPQINELRAFGGSVENPTTVVAEENLLCTASDPYLSECKLLHQFGGHAMSMLSGNQTFLNELQSTYSSAMSKGLWANTYSEESDQEYFAEGVESWFNCNKFSPKANGFHNEISTREKLKVYDAGLARLLTDFYGDMPLRYSCPSL